MQKEDYVIFEVDLKCVVDFGQYIEEYFKGIVFIDDCVFWYKVGRFGLCIVFLWFGFLNYCLEVLCVLRWEDFYWSLVNLVGNFFGWLGNGWSMMFMEGDLLWFFDVDVVDEFCELKLEESEFYCKWFFFY